MGWQEIYQSMRSRSEDWAKKREEYIKALQTMYLHRSAQNPFVLGAPWMGGQAYGLPQGKKMTYQPSLSEILEGKMRQKKEEEEITSNPFFGM